MLAKKAQPIVLQTNTASAFDTRAGAIVTDCARMAEGEINCSQTSVHKRLH